MKMDYSECETTGGSQCFRTTENAAEYIGATRSKQSDTPVLMLMVESK